jgi:hypothetical protein
VVVAGVDRELVFLVLGGVLTLALLPLGYGLAWLVGLASKGARLPLASWRLEQRRGREIFVPLVPSLIGFCALCGWALVEPNEAERPPPLAFVLASPLFLVWLRAGLRALRALRPVAVRTAAAVGMFRPRVVIAPAFARAVPEPVLGAVRAHERAHCRHLDPLRVWLAQLATDLQWNLPGARARFERWREALELCRDDEARAEVEGIDLAAGILAAARLEVPGRELKVAIAEPGTALEARIARLLEPVQSEPGPRASWFARMALVGIVVLAVAGGARFGENVVSRLLDDGTASAEALLHD